MRAFAILTLIWTSTACGAGDGGADAGGGDDDDQPPTDASEATADAPPLGEPTWAAEMTAADEGEFYTRLQPGASVEVGVDGDLARIVFRGAPRLGTTDRTGPAYASELATLRDFHYGTYRMRVQLAACAPGEELVNGLFTYFNDGTDHDGDGLVDNSEIDIEVLCGTPDVLFLTVWTEYTFATETFRKWTRAIDLSTGDLWDAPSDHEHGLVLAGNDPTLVLPDLLDPGSFVELGFEWRADRVRYFAVIDGVERTLAELTDPAKVPQLPAALMFNVWHPGEHWFGNAGPPDYPNNDATLLVDWARYWE